MIVGSHNSWSYLPVVKWWMRPLRFTARCQRVGIVEQYVIHEVRCFDLRVRFEGGHVVVVHGIVEFLCSKLNLMAYLDYLDRQGDCYVRVIHDVRTKRQYERSSSELFVDLCNQLENSFKHIHFFCGQSLYDRHRYYKFLGDDPTMDEKYASVSKPKWLDDWWPWLFAWRKNKQIRKDGSKKDVLMVDFVDIK